jgi:hypothetical protein
MIPLKKIWGKNIQVEFVADSDTINLVQIRELPSTEDKESEIQFPDEPPIHSGASIGVGDMVLPVLDDNGDNSQKTGVIVIDSDVRWTALGNNASLPKKGAVFVCAADDSNGHLQTLCDEGKIICLYQDPNRKETDKPGLSYKELSEMRGQKLRIVSNGIEGRVYEVKEDSPDADKQDR